MVKQQCAMGMTWKSLPMFLAISAVSIQAVAAFPVNQCESRPGKPQPTVEESATIRKISALASCKTAIDDKAPCNAFLGRALEILFGNVDFKTGKDSYMLANDIASGLEQPALGWKKIGVATDQSALDRAQVLANSGKPVVAARLGRLDGGVRHPGHVVLIIPGKAQKYDFEDIVNNTPVAFQWGQLVAPNSASFFLDRPDKVFFGCPLSATWQKPDGVGLYYKP